LNPESSLDFRALYQAGPGLFLVLKPDQNFTILDASDAFLTATGFGTSKAIIGRGLFEAFPGGSGDAKALGTDELRASLERVRASKFPEVMALRTFDVHRPEAQGGGTEERSWSSLNSPVLTKEGELSYILHRVEDVTEFVRLSRLGEQQQQNSDARQELSDTKHQEILDRSQALGDATNKELRQANKQLSENSEQDATANKELRQANKQLSENSEQDATANTELRQANKQLSENSEQDASANRKLTLANEQFSEDSELAAAANRFLTLANAQLREERSERKRMEKTLLQTEAQLRQAQKMEAVGRLAGGVAHDFNNILSVIIGYGNIMLEGMGPADPWRADMGEILKAGERATTLTGQLLAFSRQQVLELKVLDLNSLIVDMDAMLRRLIGEDVEFRTVPRKDLGNIKADRGNLEQVVMNLVINARDAMPAGGVLVVETANVELDEAYARDHLEVVSGAYVMLAVSDTGIGMDEATKARIFDPFYTTKEKGRGTGLGLSMVYGIVKQGGGNIWVYSEPGKGTTFRVYFPRFVGEEAVAPAAPTLAPVVYGSETVLLAEDDVQVRGMVRDILRAKGYNVLESQSSEDALAISEKHGGAIHLLLTDVIMPKMNGRELAAKLNLRRPAMRVLYMSGYTENVIIHHNVLDAGLNLLQKPFTPDGLLRKVREVLVAALV
jgi:signal transduction histidine kinase